MSQKVTSYVHCCRLVSAVGTHGFTPVYVIHDRMHHLSRKNRRKEGRGGVEGKCIKLFFTCNPFTISLVSVFILFMPFVWCM